MVLICGVVGYDTSVPNAFKEPTPSSFTHTQQTPLKCW